jgi:hypothetical protein
MIRGLPGRKDMEPGPSTVHLLEDPVQATAALLQQSWPVSPSEPQSKSTVDTAEPANAAPHRDALPEVRVHRIEPRTWGVVVIPPRERPARPTATQPRSAGRLRSFGSSRLLLTLRRRKPDVIGLSRSPPSSSAKTRHVDTVPMTGNGTLSDQEPRWRVMAR